MLTRSLRSLSVVITTALASHAANAACTIDRARPTTTLPTSASGQTFSFVATNDCTMLMFSASRGALTKTPTMGAVAGVGAHWYEVALSPAEWHSITGPDVTTLVWSVVGRGGGQSERVTTTNELDSDGDGWTRIEGDAGMCDRAVNVNPGATEFCGNTVDEDCDGQADDCGISLDDPDAVIEESIDQSWLGATLAIADVNGDGIADLVSGAPGLPNDPGRTYVSFGPIVGTVMAGDDVTITPELGTLTGDSLAAGDADGDGFGDVITGTWDRPEPGSASLLLGPISGEVSTSMADLELTSPRMSERLSYHTQIAPDVDGDDQTDIVITAPWAESSDGAVYVIPGATTGSVWAQSVASYTFVGPSGSDSHLGVSAIALDDTDGDGTDDIAMTDFGSIVYVVPGAIPSGDYDVSTVATATIGLTGEWWQADIAADYLASVDYDGDGYGDLLVGDPDAGSGDLEGLVTVIQGPVSGSFEAATDGVTSWRGGRVGALVAAGDCNGDGEADYMLGGQLDAYLAMGPVSGVVDVNTLPSLASGWEGAFLFAPDWSGDGVQELVVGWQIDRTDGVATEGVHVFYSDQF